MKLFNRKLEETYMFDFIINLFAEIADFFFTFWADNVIDKFATEFREFFLRILSDMLDDGKIELDSYTRFYDGWEQVSDLVYTKIKNTKT